MARNQNEFVSSFRRLWPYGIVIAVMLGVLAAFAWTWRVQ